MKSHTDNAALAAFSLCVRFLSTKVPDLFCVFITLLNYECPTTSIEGVKMVSYLRAGQTIAETN